MSEREITTLKLLCWCQCAQRKDLLTLVSEDELDNLIEFFLLTQNKTTGIFSLTAKGYEFLRTAQSSPLPSHQKCYTKSTVQRRLRIATFALTALKASVNIFTLSPDDLTVSPSLILTSRGRTDAQNPWGSCRAAAIIHLGDLLSAVHYVCPDIGKIAFEDEMKSFNNQASKFKGLGKSAIFAGESYQDILKELETKCEKSEQAFLTYGEAFRQMRMPIHLLSCDDTGAMQLKLMSIPNYRTAITQAAIGDDFIPSPRDVTEWDAMYEGMPFVMAADMNIRRINKAIDVAHRKGYPKIALGALKGQTDAVLDQRYQDTGLAEVFTLTSDTIEIALGGEVKLYVPPSTQHITTEGDVILAPSIKAARKAGGYHHP